MEYEEEWADRVAQHERTKSEMAENVAKMAELRGRGIGEIMALAGDPELLKVAAEAVTCSSSDNVSPRY